MDLQELKTVWIKQKTIGYSPEELNSIYHIKQIHSFTNLKAGWSWDLKLSIRISVLFIAALQILDFSTSNFWTLCMATLALQHIMFYQIQLYLLRKYSVFNNDIRQSLSKAIGKIRILLWFYRLWPAVRTTMLSIVYIVLFKPQQPVWLVIVIGTVLAGTVAVLSDILSAVLVRKHLQKLEGLKMDLVNLSEEAG
jgi:hypothetical protein